MDRNTIIGFVLIGIIMVVWLYLQSINAPPPESQKPQTQQQVLQDTSKKIEQKKIAVDTVKQKTDSIQVSNSSVEKYGPMFSKFDKGEDKVIMVETDKYLAEFSTKGGSLIKFEVKGFKTWDNYPVQLLYLEKGGELNLLFTSPEGKLINTKELYFNSNYKAWDKVSSSKQGEFKIVFDLPIDTNGTKITKTYTIKNDSYIFGMDVELHNSAKFISNFQYQLAWENSLKLTEFRSDQEGGHAQAFSLMGDEIEIIDASNKDVPEKSDLNGATNWVSSRIKYFSVFLLPDGKKADGSYITGNYFTLPENGFEKNYSVALKMSVKNDKYEKNSFKIYLGPVDYEILKGYNLEMEKSMRFSLDFIVRPIAQYAILPFFLFLHKYISNWGLVIIIFSIVMKIVLTPFSRYQMKSMKKMSELQPKMTALKEKHKDDPQKQQAAIMRLYKDEKINPAGGCLPLLLQMPILYALFGVFSSTIELRQAYFGLWIHDLSIPDVIVHLPFKVPLFGISEISGLALLMGITMFVQQKMTVKDPKQMAMVYMMPIMMTLLFTTLPSGLNLYYFMFNLISIFEQYYITHKKKPDIEVIVDTKEKHNQLFRFKGKK